MWSLRAGTRNRFASSASTLWRRPPHTGADCDGERLIHIPDIKAVEFGPDEDISRALVEYTQRANPSICAASQGWEFARLH